MIDLTGENLSAYMIREISNTVNRNPRFRSLGGDVTVKTSSMVAWGDLRVTISDINSSGNRMSPDYFMATQYGRAVLAKLENSDGLFIEWTQEVKDLSTYGVYYFNVDSVDESTREVGLTMQQFEWSSQESRFGVGSVVYFAPYIDVSKVYPTDPSIMYEVNGNTMYILSYTPNLLSLSTSSKTLVPNIDFWYMRDVTYPITAATKGGEEILVLPVSSFQKVIISDQDGYTLRANLDYFFLSPNTIGLNQFTPSGSSLTGVFTVQVDPSVVSVVHPENMVSSIFSPNGNQTIVYSSLNNRNTPSDFVVTSNNEIWLSALIRTGEQYYSQTQNNLGQTQITAKKMEINKHIIDGLNIAIGDQVFVGDQVAILVSPDITEIYEIYGSKDSLRFKIDVKANDRMTASEVSEMIKASLLVRERNNMEANGVSIYEISRTSVNESRDESGVAPSTTYSLDVSAGVDWELYIPIVTRISQFNIDIVEEPKTDFLGKLLLPPRLKALGNTQFLTNYT